MTQPLWRGVGVALVTLFDEKTRLDPTATAQHAKRLTEAGIRAILVAGTTGEADTLTDTERADLVAAVRAACPTDIPIIAGASGAWTGAATERVRTTLTAGADAVLVAPPRRTADLTGYFTAVSEAAAGAPVLAYHFPGTAGGDVPVNALATLPVQGLKDSSGDPERLIAELDAWDGWTYVGSSTLTGYASWLGAAGALLAVANAVPEDCVAAWDGDPQAQRRLLTAQLATRRGPALGLKTLVAQRYGTSMSLRAR